MAKAKQVDFRKATAAPIVLAFGPEDYLVGRTISAIKEQLRSTDSPL